METKTNQTAEPQAEELQEKLTATQELQEELARWKTKMDEARVQMNLGAKDAKDEIRPHVEKMEMEYLQAKEQWETLSKQSASAWKDIQAGLKNSFNTMKQSLENAQKHFEEPEKK